MEENHRICFFNEKGGFALLYKNCDFDLILVTI